MNASYPGDSGMILPSWMKTRVAFLPPVKLLGDRLDVFAALVWSCKPLLSLVGFPEIEYRIGV